MLLNTTFPCETGPYFHKSWTCIIRCVPEQMVTRWLLKGEKHNFMKYNDHDFRPVLGKIGAKIVKPPGMKKPERR
jgi:hypothetical protein